jgi:anaerobic magnesium-protoporphyrin IX monomethyl ester cyclase
LRILFVNPPYVGWLNDIKVEPLGLLYIASFLRRQGHEVALHDPYIGNAEADFVGLMQSWRPDAVAIAVYTVSEVFCFTVARLAKALDPRVLVIAGGPHASFTADRMLGRCRAIDVITHKESEESVAAVLAARAAGQDLAAVAGISFRAPTGRIVATPIFVSRRSFSRACASETSAWSRTRSGPS